jgi:SHS2 domain-containing protein
MHRWVEHTAEVELEIEAPTERDVLADALCALAELLGFGGAGDTVDPDERRELDLTAPDLPALLAAWLEELAYLAESEGFVAVELVDLELRDGGLRATVLGLLDDPPPLVKAVTLHRLAFEPGASGYVARVVLDV